jgi:peptidoglycan/xylan/chitin deacetylase (PgdA/CDA1 family)/CelD/BcsL family acetyltransferase involved in cellulose biosynthesis
MNLVEIRHEAELLELNPSWNSLLGESGSDTIFLSWEWLTAWWSAYGKPGELLIFLAYDDSGKLRGIAPLRQHTVRKYGQTVPAISFLGDGTNDSDYLDFITVSGWEQPVLEVFRDRLEEELKRGAVLLFNEIPETSPNVVLLKKLAESRSRILTENSVPCGTVHLPGTWEEYERMLRPRFRTKVRSVLRNLEGRPEIRFGFCEDQRQVERMLPTLFDLHARRWAQERKPGVFGWDRKREFYFQLSSRLLERGALRFSWLEWNGKVLACQYGFQYRCTYFQLQEGYEPASESWNVGLGLRAWSIRELIRKGLREYDFLGGMGRHKSDWGADTKYSSQIALANTSYKNLLFCRGPEWEAQARKVIKTLVPEKILAARHIQLERQRLSARPRQNGETVAGSGREWTTRAAAHGYFHSPLPLLARSIRDRYQLSVSPNGRWPKLSLSRRIEASGRILCYHRVNDQRDPFFPAMSTELFEREMRFVARHYTVVSLTDLLDHLEGGSTKPVLAITIDDGYQDNYQNALPILRRYGLPATIFLATGSLDSREPLWFEQLAQALKTSPREFIDLEIEIPQRFGMRTQAERLESNHRIYRLLRGLPDSERRHSLEQILQQLAVMGGEERKDKMLTWDQVRLMKAQGIDFGGHTVTHPFLSKVTREQVAWEVSSCKRRIEEELQAPVSCFAYPSGHEEDIGTWSKELLHSAGYRAAVTSIWGMNYRSTDLMELRRGQPWEENPAVFAYKMDWYQLIGG